MERFRGEPKVDRWGYQDGLGRNRCAKIEREDKGNVDSLLVGTLVCVSGGELHFSVPYICGLCSLMHLNMLLLIHLLVSLVAKFVGIICALVLIL